MSCRRSTTCVILRDSCAGQPVPGNPRAPEQQLRKCFKNLRLLLAQSAKQTRNDETQEKHRDRCVCVCVCVCTVVALHTFLEKTQNGEKRLWYARVEMWELICLCRCGSVCVWWLAGSTDRCLKIDKKLSQLFQRFYFSLLHKLNIEPVNSGDMS